ncbi:MAG: DUF4198 domain-containing protein [Candidatus Thiodiazotropha sp. (ex Cardiolucina cf. quadrata)]|nr:DUF4198 domain-containing protein [Candidatus Thiodiazotropha sp. (ex Cardiolucina cf. quadrata)]
MYHPRLLSISIVTSLGLIAFISAVVSYLDASIPSEDSTTTLSAKVGGVLSALIIFLVVGYMGIYVSINLTVSDRLSEITAQKADENQPILKSNSRWANSTLDLDTHFWHNVRYDFEWTPEEGLSPLPLGDAYLSGHIHYNGAPAAGVTLIGIFNGKFISDEITSDAEGKFNFKVPAGEWQLNRINTKVWSNKPSGRSFNVVGKVNSTLSEDFYHEGPKYGSDGLMLTARTTPHLEAKLEIAIRDNITIGWPNQARIPANLIDDSITWNPVVDASKYQVQLQHIEREGTTTTYSPVYWVNTEATTLPLEQIKTTSAAAGNTNEYQVVVYAFDEAGRLLTSSPVHHPSHSLAIRNRQIPSMQTFPWLKSDASAITEEDMEQIQKEEKLIDAAMVLAESDMPAAARELIGKLTSNHQEKRLDTLKGLILASEGQCEAARLHLESINKKWERNCMPNYYKKRCIPHESGDKR